MSEQLILHMETKLNPLEILQHILTFLGANVEVENKQNKYQAIFAAKAEKLVIITTDTLLDKLSRPHQMETLFEIRPNVQVILSLAKEIDMTSILTTVAKITLNLLETLDGDAILHMNDAVIFLRKAGILTLSDSIGFWIPERLRLVNLPYERNDITLN